MEICDVKEIHAGRKLARAVFTHEGKLLFPPGETINRRHLEAFSKWGVSSVALLPAAPEAASTPQGTGAFPEDCMEPIRASVAERFCLLDLTEPHIQALFELAVDRQRRMFLSHAGKLPPGGKATPAFQTQCPPPVDIFSLIESSRRMGTLPMVFHRLIEALTDPDATASEIGDLIATDPSLTARLLQLVNSPFFGLAQKVDNITRAVALVGTRQLITLAMGATLVTAFRGVPVSVVNMQAFWSHSLSCGVAARLLAKHVPLPDPEGFFVAGLLHDIARLLIYTQLPGHALYMLTEVRRRQVTVHSLERETLGFTHEELGGELLHFWRCPDELVRRVARHHTPLTASSSSSDAVLPVATMLIQALGYGSSGEIYIPRLEARAWEKLSLAVPSLLELCATLSEHNRALGNLFSGSFHKNDG